MDEQIKPVAWIVGNVSFGPYDFRKTEPRGWGYSEPLIKLSEHRAAIDALMAEADGWKFQLDGLEHLRLRDNAYLLDRAERAEAEAEAKQARIDQLMLDYCPNEMTPDQVENWKRHQVPAIDAARKGAE